MSEKLEKYTTDVELVSDFMNLALLYDNKNASLKEKQEIVLLEKNIIDLLPVSQSNRMSTIYSMINDIHNIHKNNMKTNEKYLTLFYDKHIPIDWMNFEKYSKKNILLKTYDINDIENRKLIKYLNVSSFPSVLKLNLDGSKDYVIKMNEPITLNNLINFAKF